MMNEMTNVNSVQVYTIDMMYSNYGTFAER